MVLEFGEVYASISIFFKCGISTNWSLSGKQFFEQLFLKHIKTHGGSDFQHKASLSPIHDQGAIHLYLGIGSTGSPVFKKQTKTQLAVG